MKTFEEFRRLREAPVLRLYASGKSVTKLAQQYGVSRRWIDKILKANGVTIRTGQLPGTKIKNSNGYMQVVLAVDSPYRPMASYHSYVLEHRLVMAESLGRLLTSNETVHHINGDRTDNRLENLQLCQGRHGNGVNMRCRCCGSEDIEFAEFAA